jgi:hypothetical protein
MPQHRFFGQFIDDQRPRSLAMPIRVTTRYEDYRQESFTSDRNQAGTGVVNQP